ncbi:1-phosphofructokinase [Cohnella sp. CFH 77786]|uniref:1-phosphofructokinase n=1 Tax=Cohnella sp. CFH 77786 TaxID=2662265 RepID=UPI001C60817F|nr:1-phosphofructokinase [Cohnella sp. CFH 77786]MBW5447536.1 1-phosphofructokinase [Cohnella sp. CFH 77786]
MKAVYTVTMNPAVDKTVTVEHFALGQLNRIQTVRTDAGGKGINVAKVLKRFSIPVVAWGITAGRGGSVIQERLQEAGIPSVLLQGEGETRTNLKVVDEYTKQTTELNEAGFRPGEALQDEFVRQFEAKLREAELVVLGGSLPPGVSPDFYRKLIGMANRAGVRTILDADGEALAEGIEAAPYALKPNIHELEALLGTALTTDDQIVGAARGLIRKGISQVLVSMGGEGSILVTEGEAYRARPFPIVPLSTVGAGDSMAAVLAYSLLNGMNPEQTARMTSAAGTITASKPGTEVATLEEVRQSLERVDITRISTMNPLKEE